jgi:hypothetical protein
MKAGTRSLIRGYVGKKRGWCAGMLRSQDLDHLENLYFSHWDYVQEHAVPFLKGRKEKSACSIKMHHSCRSSLIALYSRSSTPFLLQQRPNLPRYIPNTRITRFAHRRTNSLLDTVNLLRSARDLFITQRQQRPGSDQCTIHSL